MTLTPFDVAQRFIGELPERAGAVDNPFILWCLELVGFQDSHDETPWCSAFVNRIAWLCRLPRSKSALARSWLAVGVAIHLQDALVGDVVILQRGIDSTDGPENLTAPGHVGFFAGFDNGDVLVLGGNQSNNVTIARFQEARILGLRRLQ